MYRSIPVLTFLALTAFIPLFAPARSATCTCRRQVGPPPPPSTLPNAAQQLTSIFLTFAADIPNLLQAFAIFSAAMFEARAAFRERPRLTDVEPLLFRAYTDDFVVAYAGYAVLLRLLADNPPRQAELRAIMTSLGFDSTMALRTVGMPIAIAIEEKFPLRDPPPPYSPPNPPSRSPDASCETIVDPDGWQPICDPSPSGGPCVPQQATIVVFFNATLISFDGARRVDRLIADVPPPPTFSMDLNTVPETDDAFTREYRAVLRQSGMLDDRRKAIASEFSPNVALLVHSLALDEIITRELNLEMSVRVLFTLSAAVRDAFVGAATVKLQYSVVRPITVLQCGYRGQVIKAWKGPYQGVQTFTNTKRMPFQIYIPMPAHPTYVSGHSTIAGAASQVLKRFFGKNSQAANCITVMEGASMFEPRIGKGEDGFVDGVTNVPNSGPMSVGYSPARNTTLCWQSFIRYGYFLAKSRVFGGIHIPIDIVEGLRLGRNAGNVAFNNLLAKG